MAFIKAIPTRYEEKKENLQAMLLISGLSALFLWTGSTLEEWEALILLTAFLGFLFLQVRHNHLFSKNTKSVSIREIGITLLSMGGVMIAGKFFVDAAIELAHQLQVPEYLIGITLVAIGTSVPELVSTLLAVLKGKPFLGTGIIIGSNAFNIGFILGIGGILAPIPLDPALLGFQLMAILGVTLALEYLIHRGEISKRAGFLMMAAYLAYMLISIAQNGIY
ncbi:MAG: hypothetical protein HY917_01610 [Candidatus Diapherotrites archaeon]|nr:hypothetical protein [Candidatus Diapherotrites archaeon]